MIKRFLNIFLFFLLVIDLKGQTKKIFINDLNYVYKKVSYNPYSQSGWEDNLKNSLENNYYLVYADENFKELVFEGKFEKHKREGCWIYYHSNGSKAVVINYKKGEKNGEKKWYSNNGFLIRVENYKNNQLNGQLVRYRNYKDPFDMHYHYKTGIETYKNGVLNGEFDYWIKSEEINIKGHYLNGNYDGKIEYKNNFGEPLKLEYYQNGELQNRIIFEDKTDSTRYELLIVGNDIEEIKFQLGKLKKSPNLHVLSINIPYYNKDIDSLVQSGLSSIGTLSKLVKIEIRGAITKIPTEVFECKNLKCLSIWDVRIESIPALITNLSSLEVLKIVNFDLRLFENSKPPYVVLKEFSPLNSEDIVSLIKQLPNLKEFHYASFSNIPININELAQVEALFLASYTSCLSKRTTIPESLYEMKNLKALQICQEHVCENKDKFKEFLPNCQLILYETCIKENTSIYLGDFQSKVIQSIKEGEIVLAFDEQKNMIDTAKVLETHHFSGDSYEILKISLANDENSLFVTKNHPVLTFGKGWVNADELKVGDILYKMSESTKSLVQIKVVEIVQEEINVTSVYNLKTTKQNYFANGILIHNK